MGKEYKLLSREKIVLSLQWNPFTTLIWSCFTVDDIQVVLKCFKQNSAIPVRLPDARHQVGIYIPTTILQNSVPCAQH